MTPPQTLSKEHEVLRGLVRAAEKALSGVRANLPSAFAELDRQLRAHFGRENAYYQAVDGRKRPEDRALMHGLRNDHAAVIFTLESLAIRLRKGDADAQWTERFLSMTQLLRTHFESEEKELFLVGDQLFSADEQTAILEEMQNDV